MLQTTTTFTGNQTMNEWRILTIEASGNLEWPRRDTYTVQRLDTGEQRKITCCGQGALAQLIAAGQFDPGL